MNPAMIYLIQTPPTDSSNYVVAFLAIVSAIVSGIFSVLVINARSRAEQEREAARQKAEADAADRKIQNDLIQDLRMREQRHETRVTEMEHTQEDLFGKLDTEREGRAKDRKAHNQEIEQLRTDLKTATDLTNNLQTQITEMRGTMEQNEQRYTAEIAAERKSKADALALLVIQLEDMTRKRDELAEQLRISERAHSTDLTASREQHAKDLETIEQRDKQIDALNLQIASLQETIARLEAEKAAPHETPSSPDIAIDPAAPPTDVSAIDGGNA